MPHLDRVRALPRGFDADAVRHREEDTFCDHWDHRIAESRQCSGTPEIEVVFVGPWDDRERKTITLLLCRTHATELANQVLDAVKLVDGRDLMEMT
jgi:hypothetical protein